MVSYLFLILSLTFLPPIFADLTDDRSALLLLRNAVRGATWRWNTSSTTPCSWNGVKCDNTTNRVIALRLPGSGLRGQLPPNSVGNLTELRVLSLRRNALSGQLPSDLASCTQLEDIHLQGNSFSGEIPGSFFTLTNLLRVNLSSNNFSGNLPPGFNNLTKLRILSLENNQFTGSIPNWDSLIWLRKFNVSFNKLTGSVPSSLDKFTCQSFLGTSVSCSSSNGKKLSSGAIAGIAVASSIFLLLILIALFILWGKYKSQKILPRVERSPTPRSPAKPFEREVWNPTSILVAEQDNRSYDHFPSKITSRNEVKYRTTIKNIIGNDGLVFFGEDVEVFSLRELLSASAEVMGKGQVGSTYKAYFDSGVEVIVKRLKNICVSEEEFRAKIEELGLLVHENLEPLRGYFYGRDEKLLLYEPVPRGSLFALLHGDGRNNPQALSWENRAKIAHGAASAIEYLHSIGPGNTHGNIKSSNILLTEYYHARVTEFGLMRLVSSAPNLNGYRAPEVLDSRKTSQKADVYGFGVVLFELLTSKAPDSVLTDEGTELPNWVHSVVEEKGTIQAFDQDLLRYENVVDQMVQLLHLAISCTSLQPDRRPSMVEVTRCIEDICG